MTENLPDTNVGNIEYIRKQDAVNSVECANGNITWAERDDCKKRLEELSPADVVPVVRCRDCKHWDNGDLSFECPWDYGRHGSSDEDDFCSYGERREA